MNSSEFQAVKSFGVGQRVFWTDPDNGSSSGAYVIKFIKSDSGSIEDEDTVVVVRNDAGSNAEVLARELSTCTDGKFSLMVDFDCQYGLPPHQVQAALADHVRHSLLDRTLVHEQLAISWVSASFVAPSDDRNDVGEAIEAAISFIDGFTDDESQEGIPELLQKLETAKRQDQSNIAALNASGNDQRKQDRAPDYGNGESLWSIASRAIAALETPGDLSDEERKHLIEDGGEILSRYEQDKANAEAASVINDGISAAKSVVDNWEQGDLALAVSTLEGWTEDAGRMSASGSLGETMTSGLDAATAVVAAWCSGDLAGAVQVLDGWQESAVDDLREMGFAPPEQSMAVIEISGGNVGTISTLGDVRVIVLDYDNGDDDETCPSIPSRDDDRASVHDEVGLHTDAAFCREIATIADAEK